MEVGRVGAGGVAFFGVVFLGAGVGIGGGFYGAGGVGSFDDGCLLYTSPSPRD